MKECIEFMKAAFGQLSYGQAHVPLRSQLPVTAHEGVAIFMPAYLARSGDLGVKVVSVFPRNVKANLPTIHAVVFVIDSRTGIPTALMDGAYLTALRTGAASGAATDLLARKDAHLLTLFGGGTQARTQLEAVCSVRSITKVLVCDVDLKRGRDFVEEKVRNKIYASPLYAVQALGKILANSECGTKK